jgi:VanZ family protein
MKETLFIRWLPVILWVIFIFITSANPNPYQSLPTSWTSQTEPVKSVRVPKRINVNEPLGRYLHAAEYLVLAMFIARALIWQGDPRLVLLAMAFGLSALYAFSDEVHQLFVPGRTFQWSDLALDLGGSLIGVSAFALLLKFWRRKRQ